jgi:hypothetical protein
MEHFDLILALGKPLAGFDDPILNILDDLLLLGEDSWKHLLLGMTDNISKL